MDTQTPTGPQVGKEIDPSILTTQQLWREVAALKELLIDKVEALQKGIDVAHQDLVRVPTAMDKAIGTLKELHEEKFKSIDRQNKDRITAIDVRLADISSLSREEFAGILGKIVDYKILGDEKFNGVEKQFKERDTRVEQTAISSKVAVDAALQAAKELVGKQNDSFTQSINKSEAATTKQIDGIVVLINSYTKSADDKIDDLKDRLNKIEGTGLGISQSHINVKDNIGVIIGVGGLIIAIIVLFIKFKNGG